MGHYELIASGNCTLAARPPHRKTAIALYLVRMQRVGVWLLVEDNMACGGSMVTFTDLYRRD